MPFDIQAALKAGKSKQEILSYLAETRNISQAELQKQWLPKGEDFALRSLARFKPQEKVDNTIKPQATGGVLGFLGSIIGGEKLARGIGARLASTGSEYQKNIQQAIDSGVLTEEQADQLRIGGVSGKAMLGSAIQTAATVGTLGIGAGAKGVLGAAQLAGKVGAAGAVAGFGAGLSEDKDIKDSLVQAFTTGLTSAATAGVFTAVSKLGGAALKKLPTRIYASAAKLSKESATRMLNERQIGTLGRLKAVSDQQIDDISNTITAKITNKNGTFNSRNFLKTVVTEIKTKWQGASEKDIKTALKAWKIDPFRSEKTVDYLTANNIREGLGKQLKSAWKMEGNVDFNKDVGLSLWKNIVNTMRPATDTVDDFARFKDYIDASTAIGKVIRNQDKKFGLGLTDIVLGGVGYSAGGLPGVVATEGTKILAKSPLVKTATAVGLNEASKLVEKIPPELFDSAGRITRAGLVKALSEATK